MQAPTIPRTFAAGAVVLAAALALVLARSPSTDLPEVMESDGDGAPPPAAAMPGEQARDAAPQPTADELVAARVSELEAMSETFRNTTFLIAIRDAGYVCNELLRVYGGLDESAKWMATCSEMLAYTLSVADSGDLRVEPFLQYHDGVPWAPQRDGDGGPPPAPRIQPRLIEPQQR